MAMMNIRDPPRTGVISRDSFGSADSHLEVSYPVSGVRFEGEVAQSRVQIRILPFRVSHYLCVLPLTCRRVERELLRFQIVTFTVAIFWMAVGTAAMGCTYMKGCLAVALPSLLTCVLVGLSTQEHGSVANAKGKSSSHSIC